MTASHNVKFNTKDLERLIESAIGHGIKQVGISLQRKITRSMKRGGRHSASQPGGPPNTRTGTLRSSINYQMVGTRRVRVGTNVEYGRYLEFGATITPKKARALTVPVSDKAKRWSEQGLSPSTKSNKPVPIAKKLFLVSRKGRVPLLCQSIGGKRARVIVHYVLVGQTNIKPRPFLRPALTQDQGAIQRVFAREMRKYLKESLGAAKKLKESIGAA